MSTSRLGQSVCEQSAHPLPYKNRKVMSIEAGAKEKAIA
jgi:hypothetical protein